MTLVKKQAFNLDQAKLTPAQQRRFFEGLRKSGAKVELVYGDLLGERNRTKDTVTRLSPDGTPEPYLIPNAGNYTILLRRIQTVELLSCASVCFDIGNP